MKPIRIEDWQREASLRAAISQKAVSGPVGKPPGQRPYRSRTKEAVLRALVTGSSKELPPRLTVIA